MDIYGVASFKFARLCTIIQNGDPLIAKDD